MDSHEQNAANASAAYAEKHDIIFLFEELTRALIFARPDDVMEYLSEEVLRLRDLPGHEDKERSGDPDTERGANEFLDEHSVPQLFEELMATLLYRRPEDPFQFLSSELDRLARAHASAPRQTFFTEDDLRGMFSLFDPTKQGKVSEAQVRTGLRTLGLPVNKGEDDGEEATPSEEPTVTEEEWVTRAKTELQKHRIV